MSEEEPGDQRLHDLIGVFYEAAAEPALWREVATQLPGLFQSDSCLLLTADDQKRTQFLA
jgi:hypothetical protein